MTAINPANPTEPAVQTESTEPIPDTVGSEEFPIRLFNTGLSYTDVYRKGGVWYAYLSERRDEGFLSVPDDAAYRYDAEYRRDTAESEAEAAADAP